MPENKRRRRRRRRRWWWWRWWWWWGCWWWWCFFVFPFYVYKLPINCPCGRYVSQNKFVIRFCIYFNWVIISKLTFQKLSCYCFNCDKTIYLQRKFNAKSIYIEYVELNYLIYPAEPNQTQPNPTKHNPTRPNPTKPNPITPDHI